MLPEQQRNGGANAGDQDSIIEIPAEELAYTLLQAVQNSLDLIAISNRAGEFTFVNDAMLKMIGCRPGELIGKHFGTIFSPDNPAAVTEGIGTCLLYTSGSTLTVPLVAWASASIST